MIAGRLEGAPHETLLVVDATTGQNGLQQARLFGETAGVTGVALTKLDGSAKGGVATAAVSLEEPEAQRLASFLVRPDARSLRDRLASLVAR